MTARSPVTGVATLGRALVLVRTHPKLLLFLMFAPWTINLVLFLGGWSLLTIWLTGRVGAYLDAVVHTWWNPLLVGFGNFLAVVVAGALAYVITVIGAVIVAAPFHDRLSAAAEKAAYPALAPSSARMGVVGALREGAKTALALLFAEAVLLPINLLPGLGHLIFLLASGFVLTLGLLDVPLARREFSLRQKREFVMHHAGGIFGLSLAVAAVSFIPFLNLLTVPLFVISATLLVGEVEEQRRVPV